MKTKFVMSQKYNVGDLVQIGPDVPLYTYITSDEDLMYVQETGVVLDTEEILLALIYKIIEDQETGYGEITFMVSNDMYHTGYWSTPNTCITQNRPELSVSSL
jgi:hypothetical protein